MDQPQADNKNLNIFKSEFIEEIKDKIKITALAMFEDTIIAGDESGVVRLYTLSTKNRQTMLEKGKEESVGKNKIDSIICLEKFKVAFILSGNAIYYYSMPELTSRTAKDKTDPVVRIVNNQHKDKQNEILVITKKKRIRLYQYKTEVFRLLESNLTKDTEFTISEIPDNLCLYGNWFYFTVTENHKLGIYDLQQMKEFPGDINADSIIHVKDTFLNFTDGIGLFMVKTEPSNKTPITFSQKPFVDFSYYKTYIVSLHEGEIGVYDPDDPNPKQTLALETQSGYNYKYLLVNDTNIVIFAIKTLEKKLNNYKIWRIKELPFEDQINNMIKSNDFEEALNILNKNYDTKDLKKIEAIEEFYLECGWASLKKFTKEGYNTAMLYFHISEVNVFEVIYLFMTLLSIKPIHEEYNNILEDEEFKNTQIEFLDQDSEHKDSLNFLIDFLLDKRQFYMGTVDFSSAKNIAMQAISFKVTNNSVSCLSKQSKEKKYNLSETIQLINKTLVKAMAKVGNMKRCAEVIDTDYVNTDLISDGFLERLNNEDSKMALAYIYEKQGNYSQALDIWKEFGRDAHPKYRNPARDRSFRILHLFENNQSYAQIFEENIKWLFKIDRDQAFETLLSHEMLPIDYILSKIIPDLEKEKGISDKSYREQFLKFIDESNHRSEKYQTLYVELLIDKVFEKHGPEMQSPPEDKQVEKAYLDLQDNISMLKLFNKNVILEKIKNKWMLDLELYLYGELGNYKQALERLLEIARMENNFDRIMDFCRKNIHKQINLFTEYFELLSEQLKKAEEAEDKDSCNLFTQQMFYLLEAFEKNYIIDLHDKSNRELQRKNKELVKLRRFEILNSNKIISLLPSGWSLSNPIVYNYLNLVLRESAHLNNKYKLQKNIIKMDLTYRKSELCDLKNKSIEVHNETNCSGCGKKIANNIFVVYPNNKMYHSKCAGNPCVDPITNVDFSKKILNLNDLKFN